MEDRRKDYVIYANCLHKGAGEGIINGKINNGGTEDDHPLYTRTAGVYGQKE